MNITSIIGLMQIDLPARTVRLCDGGFVVFGGQTFTSHDVLLGSIETVDALGEGVGDEVPGLQLSFLPAGAAAAADLTDPEMQTSRCRFWIGEYSPTTGLLVGTPTLEFDGQIDTSRFEVGESRSLEIAVVSAAEKLFDRNRGNSLSPTFHKAIWPGELGHDNATGLVRAVAWGAENPPAAGAPGPVYSPGGGGGYGDFSRGYYGP